MMKRLIALALALCALWGGLPGASPRAQAAGATVYVVSNTLSVYKSASESSKRLGTMSYGESMTRVSASGDWTKVRNGAGATGYCRSDGLSTSDPNNINISARITAANTPVYKKPSIDADVWMKLKKDSTYTAVAMTRDNAWVRLKNGKYYGYVQAKRLSISSGATPAPEAAPAPSGGLNGKVYVVQTALPVYAKASSSSKSMGSAYYGQSLTCAAVSGSWAMVRNSAGATGYCEAAGLSASDPNTLSQTVYIKTADAPVHKKPSASAAVWTKLKKGSSYTAVAVTPDGAWYRLKSGSYYAYIQSKYVSTEAEPEEEAPFESRTVYVTAAVLPVYAAASANAKGLGNMYLGQSLELIGAADGWAKVRNSAGAIGYCASAGLTDRNPNVLNRPCYAKDKSVKLYAKPKSGASVVRTVAQNASLMVVCVSSDERWARVDLGGGIYAYVLATELSEKKIDDGSQIEEISPVTVYVLPTLLTVYASPSATAKSLGAMCFGETMTCTGKGGEWARVVNSQGTVGYCAAGSVSAENPNSYSAKLYAQADGAKVYRKPQTSAAVLATLAINAEVTGMAVSEDRKWYRVKSGSSFGYAPAAYFATSKIQEEESDAIAKVVTLAKKYLGVPYVYTGQSPDGFDCSGFVYYVFKNAAGVSLKRTAYSQGYDDRYKKISSKADLKVGDLLFFNTVANDDDACDHVGIYLGGGQFIHASSGGGKVIVSSLGSGSNSYYYRTYSWARRIL